MKKRILKSLALATALAMIATMLFLSVALLGNPVSRMLVRKTAMEHLQQNYADTDYEIETIVYDCKFNGDYLVYVSSSSRIDGDFYLTISPLGKLESDGYESRVEGHINVARRLMDEYGEKVMTVTNSSRFPYAVSNSYGSLNFFDEDFATLGKIDISELVNDKIYDVGELGKTNGTIELYIDSDTVSYEKAAEILIKTKEMMTEAGIYFYSIDFVLRYPPYDSEKSPERPEGEIRLYDFPCADIYEDGITERIKECAEKSGF